MTLLFTLLVLLGFIAMLCAHIPRLGLPQWPAWSLWTVAAFIWAIPQLG
jgi:hypothetical protein